MGVTHLTIILSKITLEEFINIMKEYVQLCDRRSIIRCDRKLYENNNFKYLDIKTDNIFNEDEYDEYVKGMNEDEILERIEEMPFFDGIQTGLNEEVLKITSFDFSRDDNGKEFANIFSRFGNFNMELMEFLEYKGIPNEDMICYHEYGKYIETINICDGETSWV